MNCLVPLPGHCIEGVFLRRVKRFSIEFEYQGKRLWAHTNNSGGMLGLLNKGCPALFSVSGNPKRKLPYTLERVRLPEGQGGHWVGVNTLLPNKMLVASFKAGCLDFCKGYTDIRAEAKRGESRLDALIKGPGKPNLWVECKSVTLVEDCRAAFPDAASERGCKHLRELMDIIKNGERAAMFYLCQRPDGKCFGPADYIDPAYADLFGEAIKNGVEFYAINAVFTEKGAGLGDALPITF